jgi:CheY-like chemotaxis protein/MinD-like ATPase involved in chromosome partitioning or flagellar assembly
LRQSKEAKRVANILVVDDDRDLLKLVQTVLTRAGHTLTLSMNGAEALAVAQTQDFDLAVVDVMMPVMDGYELTRRLRASERTRHMPILILTARMQVADQMSAAEAGADAYLGKPLSYKDLTDKVRQLIDAAASRAAAATGQPAPEPPTDPSRVFILNPSLASAGALPHIGSQPGAPFVSPLPGSNPPQNTRILVTLGLRGGAGTTTLATNLAANLARGGRRVCIADLSPNGGQVAMQLHLRPSFTWADWPAMPDAKVVGQTLMRHQSGLFVMTAPPLPVRRTLSSEAMQAALAVLCSFFSDVIVDAAPMLEDSTLAAVTAAHQTLIVFNSEIGAVRTALGTVRTLANLSIPFTSLRLIHNQNNTETGLTSLDVEKLLSRPADWTVPFDRTQVAALAQGMPLALSQPTGPLASAVATIINNL